jgi:hypothetical protein
MPGSGEMIAPSKEAPKKMPSGGTPAKGGAMIEPPMGSTPVSTPARPATPEVTIPNIPSIPPAAGNDRKDPF